MKVKYKYEMIVNGEVVDKLFLDSFDELIACMKLLRPWEEKYLKEKIE